MMGIMVPETCWASNKICNKNHLLHLVGILFPHTTCVYLLYGACVLLNLSDLLFCQVSKRWGCTSACHEGVCGDRNYTSRNSWRRYHIDVSGYLHDSRRKISRYPLNISLGGRHSRLGRSEGEREIFTLSVIKALVVYCSPLSLATVHTEISWFFVWEMRNE